MRLRGIQSAGNEQHHAELSLIGERGVERNSIAVTVSGNRRYALSALLSGPGTTSNNPVLSQPVSVPTTSPWKLSAGTAVRQQELSICRSGTSGIDPDGRCRAAIGTAAFQIGPAPVDLGSRNGSACRSRSPTHRPKAERSRTAASGLAADLRLSFTLTHAEAPGATCAIRFGCRFFPENAFYGCLKI